MARAVTRRNPRGNIQQRNKNRWDEEVEPAIVNMQSNSQRASAADDVDTENALLNFDVIEKRNNVSQYTQRDNSDYGTTKLISCLRSVTYEDEEKIRKHANKTLMEKLKLSIRSKWYTKYKFITKEEDARLMLTDALNRNLISVPTGANMTEEAFIQNFQNKVFTTMSTLRHNSQNLARRNYLSE